MLQQKVLKGDKRDKRSYFGSYKENYDNIIRRKELSNVNNLYSCKYGLDLVLYKRKYYCPEVLLKWPNDGKYAKGYLKAKDNKML